VVLLDLKLPGAGGLEVLHKIKQPRPDAEVVVVTGYAIVQSAVQAMKNGAYDYVAKSFPQRRTEASAEAGCNPLEDENREPHAAREDQVKAGVWQHRWRAPEMEKPYRMIAKVALSNHPVLILGESGTGKEMVASGSLVPTLIESELFGYVKGAFTFTGAEQQAPRLRSILRRSGVRNFARNNGAWRFVTRLYKAQQEQPAAQIRETYPSRDAQRGRYCPSEQLGLTFWI
jgi:DNA-binding NtrC family response regulator